MIIWTYALCLGVWCIKLSCRVFKCAEFSFKSAFRQHYVEQHSKIMCEITTNNSDKKATAAALITLFLTPQLFIQKVSALICKCV